MQASSMNAVHSSHSKYEPLHRPPLSRQVSTRNSRVTNGARARLTASASISHDAMPTCVYLQRALNAPIAPNSEPPDNSKDANALRSQPSLCGPGGPPATHPLKNASFRKNSETTHKTNRTSHRAIVEVSIRAYMRLTEVADGSLSMAHNELNIPKLGYIAGRPLSPRCSLSIAKSRRTCHCSSFLTASRVRSFSTARVFLIIGVRINLPSRAAVRTSVTESATFLRSSKRWMASSPICPGSFPRLILLYSFLALFKFYSQRPLMDKRHIFEVFSQCPLPPQN